MEIIDKIKNALQSFQIPIYEPLDPETEYEHAIIIDAGSADREKTVTLGINKYTLNIDIFYLKRKKNTNIENFKDQAFAILKKLENLKAPYIERFEFANIIINSSEYITFLISLKTAVMSNELEE